jgi:hypothetical protein
MIKTLDQALVDVVRRIARQEARKVLAEQEDRKRVRRDQALEIEERNHQAALEAAYGPGGQG